MDEKNETSYHITDQKSKDRDDDQELEGNKR